MATELTGYSAFPTYPALAGTVSPWRPIDTTTKRVRVTLSGDFTVQVEISNAQSKTVPPHLFVPADSDAEVFKVTSTPDKPVDVPGPVRFLRLRVVSGSVTGGNVEQTQLGEPLVDMDAVQSIVTDALGSVLTPGPDSITIGGVIVTGNSLSPVVVGVTPTPDSIIIGGVTVTGNTNGGI